MLTLVLAQAAAALVVILIVSVAVPCFRGPAGALSVLGLGYGLSVGLTSCVFFMWQTFLRRVLPDYGALESLVLLVLAAASIGLFVAKLPARVTRGGTVRIRADPRVDRSRCFGRGRGFPRRFGILLSDCAAWDRGCGLDLELASPVLLSGRRSLDRRLPAGELAWGLSSAPSL